MKFHLPLIPHPLPEWDPLVLPCLQNWITVAFLLQSRFVIEQQGVHYSPIIFLHESLLQPEISFCCKFHCQSRIVSREANNFWFGVLRFIHFVLFPPTDSWLLFLGELFCHTFLAAMGVWPDTQLLDCLRRSDSCSPVVQDDSVYSTDLWMRCHMSSFGGLTQSTKGFIKSLFCRTHPTCFVTKTFETTQPNQCLSS